LIRPAAAVGALALAALASGCAARGSALETGTGTDVFGIYRASLVRASEERRFKLLLFAALPDRLHAEILPPVGSPSLILDAGEGRISVLSSKDRVAYVGASSGDTLRKAIGVDTTVEDLVRAVVSGGSGAGSVAIERDPPAGPGLPRSLAFRTGDAELRLTLEKVRTLRAGAAVGAGTPPPGVETRPLEDLPELEE
jgi:hypothetical protein